jgi:hypothetical protein
MTSRFRLRKASTASPAKRNETQSRHFHARRLGPLKTAEHHRLKLAFDRADAAANRNLRFAQKLGPAEIIGVREDQVAPAAAPRAGLYVPSNWLKPRGAAYDSKRGLRGLSNRELTAELKTKAIARSALRRNGIACDELSGEIQAIIDYCPDNYSPNDVRELISSLQEIVDPASEDDEQEDKNGEQERREEQPTKDYGFGSYRAGSPNL